MKGKCGRVGRVIMSGATALHSLTLKKSSRKGAFFSLLNQVRVGLEADLGGEADAAEVIFLSIATCFPSHVVKLEYGIRIISVVYADTVLPQAAVPTISFAVDVKQPCAYLIRPLLRRAEFPVAQSCISQIVVHTRPIGVATRVTISYNKRGGKRPFPRPEALSHSAIFRVEAGELKEVLAKVKSHAPRVRAIIPKRIAASASGWRALALEVNYSMQRRALNEVEV